MYWVACMPPRFAFIRAFGAIDGIQAVIAHDVACIFKKKSQQKPFRTPNDHQCTVDDETRPSSSHQKVPRTPLSLQKKNVAHVNQMLCQRAITSTSCNELSI